MLKQQQQQLIVFNENDAKLNLSLNWSCFIKKLFNRDFKFEA
jgi:hypothetical protein